MVSFRDKEVQDKAKALIAEGKHVEAGLLTYMVASYGEHIDDLPKVQRDAVRIAFFAGAQCLLGTLVSGTNDADDEEETGKLIKAVSQELLDFYKKYIENA